MALTNDEMQEMLPDFRDWHNPLVDGEEGYAWHAFLKGVERERVRAETDAQEEPCVICNVHAGCELRPVCGDCRNPK